MKAPHSQEKKLYFPNLDGLRFFCFLSVFFYHSFATKYYNVTESNTYHFVKLFLARNGNLGVNFFFVLSGFLITFLLFTEKEKYKKISIKNFYVRRILRIWPLFYFCVFFGFVIFPFLKQLFGETPGETAHPLYYLTFLNNLDFIKSGIPDSAVLSVLWSVAVEEQFYLIWPVLIAFTPRSKVKWLLSLIIGLTFAFRLYHYNENVILEQHTFSCISDMAVGAYFAYLSFYSKNFLYKIRNANVKWWWLLYIVIVAIFLFRKQLFNLNPFLVASDRLIISILFALVIVEQNYAEKSFFKMSRHRVVSNLGVYTYGLYCLHMIGILIAAKTLQYLGMNRQVYQVFILEGGASLLLTVVLAYLSYHFFEKKFLRLKERFALIKTTEVKGKNKMFAGEKAT